MNRKFGCYFSSSSSPECPLSSSYNGGRLLLSAITIITIALLVLLPSPSSLFSFYVNVSDFVAFASPSSSPPSVLESVTTTVPVPPPPPPPPPPSISPESSQSQIQENAAVGSSSDDNFQLPDGYIIEPFLSNLSMPTSIVVDSSDGTLYVAESIMNYNDDTNISSIASSSSSSPVSFLPQQQLLEPQVRIVKADISDDDDDNSITIDVSDNDSLITSTVLNWPVIDMEVDDISAFLYAFHGYNTISRINTTSGEVQDIAIAEEESAAAGINSDGALIVTSDQENLNSNSESSSGAYNDTNDFAAATNNNNERYEDPLSLIIHSFNQIALSGKEDSREGSGSDDDEEEEDDENDGQNDNFDTQQQYSTMLYVPCIDNNTDNDNNINNDGDRYCVLSFPIDNSNNSDIADVDYNSSNPYSYSLILEDITSRPFGIAVLNSSYSAEATDASSSSFSSSISEEIEEEEQQPSETSFMSTTNEISNTSFGDSNNNTTTDLLIITSQQPSNITSARSTIYLAKLFSQTPFQDGGGSSSNNLENTINGNNSNYDHQQQLPPPSLQALVDYPYGQLGPVAVVFVPPVTTSSSSSTDDTTERNQAPSDADEEEEDGASSSSSSPFGLNETTAFIVDFGDSSDSALAVAQYLPKIIMLDVETGNITPFLTPRPAEPNFMPIDIAFDYNNNALYVLSIANNTDDLLDTGSRNNNNSGVIWKITYQGEEAEATTKSNGTDNNNNNATDDLIEPPPPPSSSNDTDSSGNTTDSDDSDDSPEPPPPPSTDSSDDDPDDDGTAPPPPSEPPAANEAPVANDQTVDIEVTATDNNEDDVLTLEFTIVSGPRHGTLGEISQEEASSSENDDGNNNTPVAKATVTYTPDQNYTGQDSFQFKVTDDSGADSNIATVTINITPVNDIPIAENDTATTNQDTPVVIDVLANDSDIDGDSITIDSVDEQSIEGGSVRIISNDSGGGSDDDDNNGGSNASERIEYIPAEGFSGTDSFEYSISDGNAGGRTDTATVTITVNAVNNSPVASNVQVTTEEDTPVPITLQATDEDEEDTLTFSVSEAANGGEISEFDSQDGTLTYTPPAGFSGQDAFNFKAVDSRGVESNTATVTITVNAAANQAPVASNEEEVT